MQAPRVGEPVLDGHLEVAGAPEHEHRGADAVERLARVVGGEREPGAEDVRVHPRAAQQAVHRALGEEIGLGDEEAAEDEPSQAAGARDRADVPAGAPPGLHDPCERDHELRDPRRAGDAGCRREHEPADELRPALGEAKRDDASEGVADDVDRPGEAGRNRVGVPGETHRRRERRRAAVAGQVGDEQAPARQEGRQLGEVPGGPAEAVDEEERRPFAALPDPHARAAILDDAGLEARGKGVASVTRIDYPWINMDSTATGRGE